MCAQTRQDRGTGKRETEYDRTAFTGRTALPGVKRNDLSVGGLLYLTAAVFPAQTENRTRGKDAACLRQIYSCMIPERDRDKRITIRRGQADPGDAGSKISTGHGWLLNRNVLLKWTILLYRKQKQKGIRSSRFVQRK